MRNRKSIPAALLLTLLFVLGCAGPRPRDGGAPGMQSPESRVKIEPQARTLYYQAERAFLAKRYDAALDGFRNVKQRFPRGNAHMMATYRLGTIFYYRGQYSDASREFEFFLSRYPRSELTFDVMYNLAASEYQQGNYDKAGKILGRFKMHDIQAQGPRRAEVVYQLMAQVAGSMNNHTAAVIAYAAQLQLPLEESKRGAIEADIDDQLSRVAERDKLEHLLTQINEPGTRGRINERLAALNAAEYGIPPSSPGIQGVGAPPTSGELAPGEVAGSALISSSSGDSLSIGVVLPLTGKAAPYGRRALEGILLASGVYSRAHPVDFKIFVEDTASNPAIAQNAVEQLFYKQRVMAVIGPIGWRESVAVAEKAQELGVLNLSLTAKQGISEKGAYLFQNALTAGVQIESLVRHVINEKKYRRFAILAPRNAFGDDMAGEFWEQVEALGGRVVGYETYPADEKDFQSYIRSLTGLSDMKDRSVENAKLGQYIAEVKAKTGREPKSARLQPIVDFDAIFIPDSPKTVGQIAASMQYFDVKGAALLGTTEWNNEQLYRRAGRYVEGALFPGGLSLGTRNPRQREFIKLYAEAYGSAPDMLASQAYEAMQVIGSAIRESGSSDRNSLVKQVMAMKDFEGPMGPLTFDQVRIARRTLPVFALEPGGNIVEQ